MDKPKILMVDDDSKNLLALETLLDGLEAELVSVTSGEKALEALMEDEFSLVLMDVQMPGMDGFETAKLMRNNKQYRSIPIIFVTAISKEDRYVQKGHEMGAVDYLFKPLDPVVLLSKVQVFLDYYVQNQEMKQMLSQLNETQDSLIQSNKELEALARFDSVTGLANRLDFTEFLEVSLENSKRYGRILGLLFLDLDNFKYINDSYGHHAGDELLKQVAERLTECLRGSDFVNRAKGSSLISRLGGDEFAMVLSEIDKPESAAKVAKRILDALNQPFRLNDQTEIKVGVSIGIACHPFAGDTPESLCKNADMAMYDAKKMGKNTYRFFSEELNVSHLHHIRIEEALKKALAEDQFYLVYQPIVDLQTEKTIAVEVLCRCALDELSDVQPQEFIEIAEESGVMPELGKWIFSTALAECEQSLFSSDSKIYVHVNVSTKQLQDTKFSDLVKESLSSHGVSPEKFTFELTETAILDDMTLLAEQLNQLSDIGSRVSIDDFGTGYSSMAWLRHLPISSLKIDKEFIDEVHANPNDSVITKSIIRLADNLELTCIAEGIESQDQLDFLVKHHCPLGQGFYFSRPLRMADLVKFLQSN